MFSYTSFNILNILLMFLWLSFSFAVPFETSVCVLLYCAFTFMNTSLLPSSTMVFSFLYYILGTESSSFFVPVLFLLLYLLLHSTYYILSGRCYTTCFLLVFQEKTLVLSFHGFKLSCFHIFHSLYRLPLSSL